MLLIRWCWAWRPKGSILVPSDQKKILFLSPRLLQVLSHKLQVDFNESLLKEKLLSGNSVWWISAVIVDLPECSLSSARGTNEFLDTCLFPQTGNLDYIKKVIFIETKVAVMIHPSKIVTGIKMINPWCDTDVGALNWIHKVSLCYFLPTE